MNTSGGAYIEGSVNTDGGHFVGRDLSGYIAEQVSLLLANQNRPRLICTGAVCVLDLFF
jgi:hypothetical protein